MSYSSEVLSDSPAGYYRCQESSGLLQDSSGNARHTTASSGTAQYSQASPILSEPSDTAVYFDGDASFSAPDSGFDFGNTFTLECWFKRTTTGIFESFFWKGLNAYFFGIGSSDDKLVLQRAGVSDLAKSTGAITDTDWHHAVATKSGATSTIYLDGADVTAAGTDSTCTDTTDVLTLGDDTFGDFANSRLDELALYPTALSQARVEAHFDAAAVAAITPTLAWIRA